MDSLSTVPRLDQNKAVSSTAAALIILLLLMTGAGCRESVRLMSSTPSGAAIFAEKCAVCHTLPILGSMFEQNRGRPPGFVYDALSVGNMRRVGGELDAASRRGDHQKHRFPAARSRHQ